LLISIILRDIEKTVSAFRDGAASSGDIVVVGIIGDLREETLKRPSGRKWLSITLYKVSTPNGRQERA